jgi:hypothetical protein
MNARVYGALIADTFQEARARWLFWGLSDSPRFWFSSSSSF